MNNSETASFVFGILIGIALCTAMFGTGQIYNKTQNARHIKAGLAEYDKTTGEFRWKTVEEIKGEE
jgi:hypothetical protein